MKKNIVILGPPGAGKGTQATKIANHYDIPHISTGEILRNNKDMETEYGTPRDYIDDGEFVPDELMLAILQKRLEEPDTKEGFVLDGFPRNLKQAEMMEEIADITLTLYLEVSEDNILERLTGRRRCVECGATYHIDYDPPRNGACDNCGGKLIQRKDDRKEVVMKRLETYEEETHPMVEMYREEGVLREVDGNPSIKEVWERIKTILHDRFGEPS